MDIALYCRETPVGTVELGRDGACVEIRAFMPAPNDGLYRAVLVGERGERLIGVMEPRDGCAEVCRRLYWRDVAALGALCRGEARCSYLFQEENWCKGVCPPPLDDPFWANRLADWKDFWWRKEGSRLHIAVAAEEDGPFPLETLFCLARLRQVCGRRCVLYTFDGDGRPLLP